MRISFGLSSYGYDLRLATDFKIFTPTSGSLINPKAIVDALNAQSRKTNALAAHEAELRRRQTEWNALHFEILRRLVTDIARGEIDNQHLAHRV